MDAVVLAVFTILVILAAAWARRNQVQADSLQKRLLASEESRQQQVDQLESFRSRDQLFIQNAGEALFIFDQKDGSLIEINRQAEDLLGYTQGSVTHLTFRVLFSREHRQRVLRMISSVVKQGEAEISKIKFRRKDGSQFIGEIKARTGRMQDRQIIYGSFRDVTQAANLQLELWRHNRHLTLLNEISQRVAEGHNLQRTLEIILDEVINSFAISGGGIFLLEHSGTE
ncbi:MAG: PAS domain S-box protein, partial [Desulfuromonadales bacterium]|nr:PAS domain S-box protein [Desulfuromonadales bacterium]